MQRCDDGGLYEIPAENDRAKILALIKECTAPPGNATGTMAMLQRTNRLLGAILERLHEK